MGEDVDIKAANKCFIFAIYCSVSKPPRLKATEVED